MIELGRTYRDGLDREVRIICVDAKRQFTPIIGLVTTTNGAELIEAYREDGTPYPMGNANHRLNIPRRHIDLDNAISLIRARESSLSMAGMNLVIEDLRVMPFKEIGA